MLRLVLDTIPQRVFWKDRNLVYVGCNKALALDSGYADSNDILGKTDYDMSWADIADQYRADDLQIMDSGQPKLNFEEPQIKSDGTQTWLKTSKVPLHDKDGRVIGVLGTYEDITEHKRAEAELAAASSLLETLLQNSPDCIYFKDSQSRFVRYSNAFEKLFKVPEGESLRGKTDFDFFLEEHARPAYDDEQDIIRTGNPIVGKLEKEPHPDSRVTWALTTKMPWRDKEGKIIGTFGISKDVTVIKEAEAELAYERELFQSLLETLPDSIYFKDRDSRFVRVSKSKAAMTLQLVKSQWVTDHPAEPEPAHLSSVQAFATHLIGKTDFDTFGESFAREAFQEEHEILRTGNPVIGKIERETYPGKCMLVTKMPWRDRDGNIIGTFGVSRDITALKEAETKLEAVHQRLIETSRLAGMAEVATDVLHNVGNVLNSVNVSCTLTLDRVKSSKVSSLVKVSSLLNENSGRLQEFLTQDPRGRQIPEFLAALSEHFAGEQTSLLTELEHLVKHIDHIKQIVAMQQTYAKVVGVLETVSPTQLVEDALHINAAALLRHKVQVQRHFKETPPILTERHKVLQILVNLIRNAKYAMDEAKLTDKVLTIKVEDVGGTEIKIQVIDNGIGIPRENLTRIFSHGFTTRRNGHGFGLHSSALAVRELGGSIQAHSDGPGHGAIFTLVLPCAAPSSKPTQEPE
jgi:PAS domain S-box-containing protein